MMIKLIYKRREIKRVQEFVRKQELERENTALLGRVDQLLCKDQPAFDTAWREPRYQWQ